MQLSLRGISKSYKKSKVKALDGLNLTMSVGVYGLLGPNGAGKSTLINIISGLLRPDEGSVSFDGGDYLNQLGLLPQNQDFYPNYTVHELVMYIMALKNYKPKNPDSYADELLHKVNLYDERKKKIRACSGGMKQRLGIAQAIIGEPKILIFDEPTAGLDPKERIRFRNLISSLSNDKIVLLATHIVTDVAFIAKDIILIDKGRVIEYGTQGTLCAKINDKVWGLDTEYETVMKFMQTHKVSNVVNSGNKYSIRVICGEKPHENVIQLKPNLEDVCIYHYGEM